MAKTQKKEMLNRIFEVIKNKPLDYLENLYVRIANEGNIQNISNEQNDIWETINKEIYEKRQENNQKSYDRMNQIIF